MKKKTLICSKTIRSEVLLLRPHVGTVSGSCWPMLAHPKCCITTYATVIKYETKVSLTLMSFLLRCLGAVEVQTLEMMNLLQINGKKALLRFWVRVFLCAVCMFSAPLRGMITCDKHPSFSSSSSSYHIPFTHQIQLAFESHIFFGSAQTSAPSVEECENKFLATNFGQESQFSPG